MYSDFDLQCEVATNFMNNKVALATEYCYNIIHNRHGNVPDTFYQMLFDMLKVQNAKKLFEDAAEQYHRNTGRLPPDWENKDFNKMVSDFHTLEIIGGINASIRYLLNKFYKSCSENGFGRLDFNQLKLKDSDSMGMNMLLQIMYKLKRIKEAEILLMGEHTILNFDSKHFMLEKTQEKNDNSNISDNKISHNASLSLLEEVRARKNAEINKKYKEEYDKYKFKEMEILKQISQIQQQLNPVPNVRVGETTRNNIATTPSQKRRMDEQLERDLEKLRDELTELRTTEPKASNEVQETYIEKIIREKYNEDDGNSHLDNKDNSEEKQLQEIAKKEELLYLLKLEVLQWNGERERYLTLADEFSAKYKKFATDYQIEFESRNRVKRKNRIGTFQITTAAENNFNSVSKNTPVIVSLNTEINAYNLNSLMQYLDNIDPNTNPVVFMNLYRTNFFNYEAASALMLFMQEQKRNGRNYDFFIKNANSLIKVIFEMSGLSEYIKYQ